MILTNSYRQYDTVDFDTSSSSGGCTLHLEIGLTSCCVLSTFELDDRYQCENLAGYKLRQTVESVSIPSISTA